MYAIYGNMDHQYTPNVSINLPLTWIRHGYKSLEPPQPCSQNIEHQKKPLILHKFPWIFLLGQFTTSTCGNGSKNSQMLGGYFNIGREKWDIAILVGQKCCLVVKNAFVKLPAMGKKYIKSKSGFFT